MSPGRRWSSTFSRVVPSGVREDVIVDHDGDLLPVGRLRARDRWRSSRCPRNAPSLRRRSRRDGAESFRLFSPGPCRWVLLSACVGPTMPAPTILISARTRVRAWADHGRWNSLERPPAAAACIDDGGGSGG